MREKIGSEWFLIYSKCMKLLSASPTFYHLTYQEKCITIAKGTFKKELQNLKTVFFTFSKVKIENPKMTNSIVGREPDSFMESFKKD